MNNKGPTDNFPPPPQDQSFAPPLLLTLHPLVSKPRIAYAYMGVTHYCNFNNYVLMRLLGVGGWGFGGGGAVGVLQFLCHNTFGMMSLKR